MELLNTFPLPEFEVLKEMEAGIQPLWTAPMENAK